MDEEHNAVARKAEQVYRRLLEVYGAPDWQPEPDPVSQLVATILSQNTNDLNRDVAYERLRLCFPTWEQVRDADSQAVIEAIRPAGLANQKGPRIQEALRRISQECGALDLGFLAQMPVEDAKAWLGSIKGVGPKTTAIVLLFALNRPAFPVDTHVHRVTKRLGLIGPRVTREKAHALLERLARPEVYFVLHVNLIRHGRQVCHSRKPRCIGCVLRDLCEYSSKQPA